MLSLSSFTLQIMVSQWTCVTSVLVHPSIMNSSKVMLKAILNRLKPQAKEIIPEDQAAFGAGRSTTEQIFHIGLLCEKYLQHQKTCTMYSLTSNKPVITYGMQKYTFSANPLHTTEQLNDKVTGECSQINGSTREWSRTTV